MNMFNSKPKNFGKIVKEDEIKVSEQSEQLRFCKWLKREYPQVLFRSDVQNQSARSPQMQNILQILDPYRSGMPDIVIYQPMGPYYGLMIEMKRVGASINTEHGRDQQSMHERLREKGWKIIFAWGAENAKQEFKDYINYRNHF